MAHLRASKKSGHASIIRQESNDLGKRINVVIEEMDEFDDAEAMDVDDVAQEEESEEAQSTSAQELLSNMVAGARKRNIAKKKHVMESYDTTSKNVRESLNTVFDEHEEKSSTTYEAQLKRLKELLAHKAKLEAEMEAKLTIVRGSYGAHSRDLETVLNRRVKELK